MDLFQIPQNSVLEEDMSYTQSFAAQDEGNHVQKQSHPHRQTQLEPPLLKRKSRSTPVYPLSAHNDAISHHLLQQDDFADTIPDREDLEGDFSFHDLGNHFQPPALISGDSFDSVMSEKSSLPIDNTSRSSRGPNSRSRRHNTFPSTPRTKGSRGTLVSPSDATRPARFRRDKNPTDSTSTAFDDDVEVQSRKADYTSSKITQIFSTLEPVVKLPIEVTDQERGLLHFYLTFGRQWIWGTSDQAYHCPALDIARYLMQNCTNFVLTSILLAETILNTLTGRCPQPTYFLRRARIYKAVNGLLSDVNAPMPPKINAIMYLAAVEYANGQTDLQNMHIRALDDLISAKGGLTVHLSCLKDINIFYMSARFYTSQFIRAEVQISTLQQLESITTRYTQMLRRIRNWNSSLQSLCSYVQSLVERRSQLSFLIDYMSHLIELWLSEDQRSHDFHKISGAHFCALSIALTLVELDQSHTTTFEFLQQLQTNMIQSTDTTQQCGNELNKLHAYTAAHIIGKSRSEVLVDGGVESEIRISQAIVDAQKVFVLLNTTRRIEIVSRLMEKIFGNPRLEGAPFKEELCFDEQCLQSLREELAQAWLNQRSDAEPTVAEVAPYCQRVE